MPRAAKPDTPIDEPTKPRPRDEWGFELDEHGLPFSGPERLRRLEGRPDPAFSATPDVPTE